MKLDAAGRRFKTWLEGRGLPWQLAVLALVLGLPYLDLGLQIDDYFHRLALSDPPQIELWARGPASLFVFFDGDPEAVSGARDAGVVPWWTSPDLVLSFFRPVSGTTHWLDWRLWPDRPALMHLHSLLWFAMAAALVTVLLRELVHPTWLGGLAALLFVVDDGHGLPVVWLANRNAMVAMVFGLLALIAHLRWRRGSGRWWCALSLAALAGSLLAVESGVAVAGYIAAHALFLEPRPWSRRVRALLPATALVAVWLVGYHLAGYGAVGSAVYVEPMHAPGAFAAALVERAPLLLAGQLGLPMDLAMFLSIPTQRLVWLASLAVVTVVAVLLAGRLRRDPVARFAALGMALALLPASATFAASRLLMFASLGGAVVMGMLLADLAGGLSDLRGRWLRGTLLTLLGGVHLVIAPLSLLTAPAAVAWVGDVIVGAARTLAAGAPESATAIVVVNTPSAFVTSYGPLVTLAEGGEVDGGVYVLGSGIHTTTVKRIAEDTVAVSMEEGYLPPPGTTARSDPRHLDLRFAFQTFDLLYVRHRAWQPGERLRMGEITAVVERVTEDGRPLEVHFRFPRSAADGAYHWVQWLGAGYSSFALPAVGGTVVLGPVGGSAEGGQ